MKTRLQTSLKQDCRQDRGATDPSNVPGSKGEGTALRPKALSQSAGSTRARALPQAAQPVRSCFCRGYLCRARRACLQQTAVFGCQSPTWGVSVVIVVWSSVVVAPAAAAHPEYDAVQDSHQVNALARGKPRRLHVHNYWVNLLQHIVWDFPDRSQSFTLPVTHRDTGFHYVTRTARASCLSGRLRIEIIS